ncbi:hypothetical protein HU200_027954 [Digitaria exilis]|uniref:F-box protein AT5G49610-like beta-propeller domain-containing protein n=1 Tax=Digitaria exilis TaxID=1010633 RepID=A0A835BSM1_9POAL|nr:hypothetical protein HU200_027954 [Digitaria exilis]
MAPRRQRSREWEEEVAAKLIADSPSVVAAPQHLPPGRARRRAHHEPPVDLRPPNLRSRNEGCLHGGGARGAASGPPRRGSKRRGERPATAESKRCAREGGLHDARSDAGQCAVASEVEDRRRKNTDTWALTPHRLRPAFLRRYRAFHPGAPLLGFFYSMGCWNYSCPFVPTREASPFPRPACGDDDYHHWRVLDCRHGRVLLVKSSGNFVVWDPITGHREEVPALGFRYSSYSALVLCPVAGCHHRDCHGGSFSVVFVGNDNKYETIRACVYSSETRAWGTPDSTHLDGGHMFSLQRVALIGDEIYCLVDLGSRILKYDLAKHYFLSISLPCEFENGPVLMQSEDGSLGLAGSGGSTLYIWSRMVNAEGITEWELQKTIKLKKMLRKADAIDYAEGVGVFIMSTRFGAFTFELKSGLVRKISEKIDYCAFFPFISFFTPGAALALYLFVILYCKAYVYCLDTNFCPYFVESK